MGKRKKELEEKIISTTLVALKIYVVYSVGDFSCSVPKFPTGPLDYIYTAENERLNLLDKLMTVKLL